MPTAIDRRPTSWRVTFILGAPETLNSRQSG